MSVVGDRATTRAERQQRTLAAELTSVAAYLDAYRNGTPAPAPDEAAGPAGEENELDRVTRLFGLSRFERATLVLAAGVHLDGQVASIVSAVHDGGDPRPTFGLALASLPDPHWDAVAPGSPLRWWRLLQLGPGPTLATRPLVVDERVLHCLTGIAGPDERLEGIASHGALAGRLTRSQTAVVDDLAAAVLAAEGPCVVHVDADDPATRLAAADRLALVAGRHPVVVRGAALPPVGPDLATVVRHLDREALLADGLLVVEPAGISDAVLSALLETSVSPVVVVAGDVTDVPASGREAIRGFVPLPAPAEQRGLWEGSLNGAATGSMGAAIEEVSQHYRFGAATVDAVARRFAAHNGSGTPALLRELCRTKARVRLEGLADRIDAGAVWDDLVLPDGHNELLRDIVRQVRHRAQVYERWGFGERGGRGLGVTALFSGESGTGKTLAAEVIAAELGLDLYRIDLSSTVSKYIGETEKNLRRLFDGAEVSGAVLLFDEADALFGKRGEVRDGHDRYANLEVAYLLQRMETYRGLAILTTNLRSNLDRAFLRRLRFVVHFPFPDETQRAGIWRRVFPPSTPLEGVDAERLARLNVAGGSIRSIALAAAFAAAEDGSAVTPAHVLRAARTEYAKAERPLTDAEVAVLS